MREYINIIETVLLNEHFFEQGDLSDAMLGLNVFTDTEDDGLEGFDEEFVETYREEAEAVRRQIMALPLIPLSADMVAALEEAHYDGSDAYEEGMEETLGSIYDEQLELCNIMIEDIKLIAADKDLLLTSFLNVMKGGHYHADNLLSAIDSLRKSGTNYPEFAAIEKSLKAG